MRTADAGEVRAFDNLRAEELKQTSPHEWTASPGSEGLGEHSMTSQVLRSRQWSGISTYLAPWQKVERQRCKGPTWSTCAFCETRSKLLTGSCQDAGGNSLLGDAGGDLELGTRRRKCILFCTIMYNEKISEEAPGSCTISVLTLRAR